MPAHPQFRITLNGWYVPNVRVQKAPDGGYALAVRTDVELQDDEGSVQEADLGWFLVENRPDLVLRYRDEDAWALLPLEMKQASVDKGWNSCAPEELIGILWTWGVLQ